MSFSDCYVWRCCFGCVGILIGKLKEVLVVVVSAAVAAAAVVVVVVVVVGYIYIYDALTVRLVYGDI